jgi:hypothetical protein
MNRTSKLGAVGVLFAGLLASPDADACGGCFPPPGEQASVVTDHRMVLTVSKNQSTLYDQIQYSGSPSEFAWVLPIVGTVEVGLSSDSLFTVLHNLSAVTVQEPPRNCPAPQCPFSSADENARGSSSGSGGSFSADGGVTVLKKEVVGPYETVQLESADPLALQNWLTQNGFNIPEDIKPVIGQYVGEHFNFLALRLRPGQGVSSMRPVRVTTQGASAVLPLRMVAAGTGANVGITLWVVGEGRYEPQNFQSFLIKDDDLQWDWDLGASNYKDLRAERAAIQPGKMWEIESSVDVVRQQIEGPVRNGFFGGGGGSGGDYLPVEQNGTIVKSADAVREEDLTTLFNGIAAGDVRLTRLRSDLSRAGLATDLSVVASQDQQPLAAARRPKKEKGQPLCPIYDGNCRQIGTAPRDQAQNQAGQAAGGGGGETFSCQTSASSDLAGFGGLGGLGAFFAIALLRGARERKNRP